MTFIPMTSRYPNNRPIMRVARVSRRSKPFRWAARREVAEVEAHVLKFQMRTYEDERLPFGEALEQLLPLRELRERLDVRRREIAVEDLEQTERGLGLRGRHRRRTQEDLVMIYGIHAGSPRGPPGESG